MLSNALLLLSPPRLLVCCCKTREAPPSPCRLETPLSLVKIHGLVIFLLSMIVLNSTCDVRRFVYEQLKLEVRPLLTAQQLNHITTSVCL